MPYSGFSLRSGRRLTTLLGAGAILLVLMGALAWVSRQEFDRLAVANAWNLHTYQVLMPLTALDTSLDEEESRLRGYALTGDADFGKEARQSNEHILVLIDEVNQLMRDRADQRENLARFKKDYLVWNGTFVAPLLDTTEQGAVSAWKGMRRANLDTAARHQSVEKLQRQLDAMEDIERQLMVKRGQDQDQTQRRMAILLLLGSASGIIFLGGLFGLLWRGARSQEIASSDLRGTNIRLLQEVEARMEAQERLRESEESYRHLAEDSLDLICAYGRDGRFSYVSPASMPLLGFRPVELVGLEPRRLFHADDFAPDMTLQQWLEVGGNKTHTVRARRKDGSWVWLEIVGHAIMHPESGQITQFHTTARDISARVREEGRRQEMLDGLHATVRVADRLIEARTEESLLRLAAELAHSDLGCHDCQIWLADDAGKTLQGAFALTSRGAIDPISHRFLPIPPELRDRQQGSGERWNAVTLHSSNNTPGSGDTPLTTAFPLVVGQQLLGVMFVSDEFSGGAGSARSELGRLFASLLSTLLERVRSEGRSRQTQNLLETVVDNAPLILYAIDSNERYVFSIGRALDSLGFSSQTLVGRTVGEVMGKDHAAVQTIRATLRGEVVDGPSRMNGQEFDAFRRPLRDERGHITGMVGVLVNVTDRARAQHALAQSEARYRSVVNSVSEVIFQTDAQAHWTFLNAAWHEIMGYTVEESIGRSADDFVHPDDIDAVRAHAQMVALDPNASRRTTARYRTRDGEVRWMEVFVRPLLDEMGEFAGFAGTLADITERFLAERALRQTTEMQRAILGSASYAIFSCDACGIIQTFNRAAEEMLLLPASAVCGFVRAPLLIASEDLRARSEELGRELNREIVPWEALTLSALQKGRDEREWTGIRSNGERFPMRLSISPLRGEDGEVAGFVAIGYDLSESRRIEKLKSEFVSVVSHELRTPLTSIRGALGLLGGGVAGVLPDRARQMIDIAHKNAERLVLLINDILDIEKIESGQMQFHLAPLDITQLVNSALQSNAPYAQGLNVSLVDDSPDEQLCIDGDEARLAQVMANLLSNAAKFTPQGGEVRVRTCRISASAAQGCGARLETSGTTDWVRVDVFDGGSGVPAEFEGRLFERFAQADSSATRAKGGTGLGLAISRAIIEKMQGVLRYTPANATTGEPHSFNFLLPLIPDPDKKELPMLPTNKRERLLVCEDDPDIAAFLHTVLQAQGFDVTLAPTLASALAALETAEFDAMTLDLMLSDGDGITFLDELRGKGFDLPVVVVSAYCEEGRVRGGALDVLDWLHKPIDSERLSAVLSRFKSGGSGRARILHVEDDADIRQVTRAVLGSKVEVREAATLQEARELLANEHFDLALLDIGLPDGDGLELVPLLAQMTPPVPVALFSAQEAEGVAGRQVAAALVKSRSNNAALRSTIERLLSLEPDSLISK
ncbi:sensor histidine kinase TmoS [Abditibacteriota bacterium]|nr:sensor histidine kinase TmoS [Abditibacteriota bacterium]